MRRYINWVWEKDITCSWCLEGGCPSDRVCLMIIQRETRGDDTGEEKSSQCHKNGDVLITGEAVESLTRAVKKQKWTRPTGWQCCAAILWQRCATTHVAAQGFALKGKPSCCCEDERESTWRQLIKLTVCLLYWLELEKKKSKVAAKWISQAFTGTLSTTTIWKMRFCALCMCLFNTIKIEKFINQNTPLQKTNR